MPITLAEARAAVGQLVVYRAPRWPAMDALNPERGKPEEGVITSVNDYYVFVRYDLAGSGQATDPADLEFVANRRMWGACPHGVTGNCLECIAAAEACPCTPDAPTHAHGEGGYRPVVGGPPEAPEQEETCGEMDDAGETWCGRNPGHDGDHAARDYDVVTRVWPQR